MVIKKRDSLRTLNLPDYLILSERGKGPDRLSKHQLESSRQLVQIAYAHYFGEARLPTGDSKEYILSAIEKISRRVLATVTLELLVEISLPVTLAKACADQKKWNYILSNYTVATMASWGGFGVEDELSATALRAREKIALTSQIIRSLVKQLFIEMHINERKYALLIVSGNFSSFIRKVLKEDDISPKILFSFSSEKKTSSRITEPLIDSLKWTRKMVEEWIKKYTLVGSGVTELIFFEIPQSPLPEGVSPRRSLSQRTPPPKK